MKTNNYIETDSGKWKRKNDRGEWVYYKKLNCHICGKTLFRRYQDYKKQPDMKPCCKTGDCKSKLWQDILSKNYEIGKEYKVDDNTIRIFSGKSWTYKRKTKCSECGKEIYRDRPEREKYNFCDRWCDYKFHDPKGSKILDYKDTPDFCYLLGLIATDGCVNKKHTIDISLTLHDHKILKDIYDMFGGCCYIVKFRNMNSSKLYTWKIYNYKFTKFLSSVGIVNKKSLLLNMEDYFNKLTDDNQWHFLRGVFDGDGCLSVNKQNQPSIGLTSGSKSFINMVHKKCCEINGSKAKILFYNRIGNNDKHHKYYNFSFSCNKAIPLIKLLYKNISNHLYLDRKYNKIASVLNITPNINNIYKLYPKSDNILHYYKGMNIFIKNENRGYLISDGLKIKEIDKILQSYNSIGIKVEII